MGFVAAAGIGAVGAIGSSAIQSNAASDAASQQVAAQNNATATQQQMFNQSQQNLAPFIQQGNQAATKVSQLEGLNGADSSTIQNTLASLPGYQFQLAQGLKSVQNSATARGLGISGDAQAGAANYATGLSNTYYNNYLTGIQNTENTGANAAAGLASTSATVGSNIASNITGAGNAAAAGTLGSANAVSSGLLGGTNGLQNAFYANKILGSGSGSTANGIYNDAGNPLNLSPGSTFTNNDLASISQDFANGV